MARPRLVRTALQRAVAEARASGRIGGSVEVELRVLLADRYAAAVDAAAKGDDLAGLVRAGARLEAVVAQLPLSERPPVPVGGGAPGDGDGGRGNFLELVDGDPEVGDSAHG